MSCCLTKREEENKGGEEKFQEKNSTVVIFDGSLYNNFFSRFTFQLISCGRK